MHNYSDDTLYLPDLSEGEQKILRQLIDALKNKKLPADFLNDNERYLVMADKNGGSGNIYLIFRNSYRFRKVTMRNGIAEELYTCDGCDRESFLDDLDHANCDESFDSKIWARNIRKIAEKDWAFFEKRGA